jgi:hypothetical protein
MVREELVVSPAPQHCPRVQRADRGFPQDGRSETPEQAVTCWFLACAETIARTYQLVE